MEFILNPEIKRIMELRKNLELLKDGINFETDITMEMLQKYQDEFKIIAGNFEALSDYIKRTYNV